MYEMNILWEKYYKELNPDKRKKMMKELLAAGEDDGANAIRQKIYTRRYTNPKAPSHPADMFLMECAYLPSLYRKRKSFLTNMKKEIKRTMLHLYLDEAQNFTEIEKNALYWEMRNAVKRYLKTCQGSKYGSSFMGLSKASEEEKIRLAGRDIWQMSAGIARYMKLEDEMKIFCDAAKDEYESYFEDGQEIYEYFVLKFKNDE